MVSEGCLTLRPSAHQSMMATPLLLFDPQEECPLNWDHIDGGWKRVMGTAPEQWGRLTDDELDQAAGRREQLIGKVQERYGYARDRAEREVDDVVRRW
jgi:uncharacterized protein YjbJ (UPF0337 family)